MHTLTIRMFLRWLKSLRRTRHLCCNELSLCPVAVLSYHLLYPSASKGLLRVYVALHLLCDISQGHKEHQDNFGAGWMLLIPMGRSWRIKCWTDLEGQNISGVTAGKVVLPVDGSISGYKYIRKNMKLTRNLFAMIAISVPPSFSRVILFSEIHEKQGNAH